jgi:hypothetical protein
MDELLKMSMISHVYVSSSAGTLSCEQVKVCDLSVEKLVEAEETDICNASCYYPPNALVTTTEQELTMLEAARFIMKVNSKLAPSGLKLSSLSVSVEFLLASDTSNGQEAPEYLESRRAEHAHSYS